MKSSRESTGIASLASQSVVYGFGGVLARMLGFVLVPIYLHAAGPSAFGTVELMLAAVLFASILLRMGIVVSMSRFTIGETEQREWAPIVHTIFTFVMVAATAGVVVGFLLRGPIGDALEVSDDIVYAGLFGLWISMNYDVMARVYRIERRARAWVQYTLLNVVLTAVLTVVLVVWFDTGALGLLIGNFTGTAIVYAILIVARRETVGLRRFETPVLRELLVFSLPLMPANIALWALNLADRLQVQQLASHQALGSYSAAARVSMAMAMIMGAFQTAWAPYAHQVRGTEGDAKAKITYARVLTYWSVVMGWGLVGISLLAPPYIRATFPSSTFDAIPVVPLLAIGIVLYGCYLIVNIGVTVSRKTRMTPIICTFAAALNIGLNFCVHPRARHRRGGHHDRHRLRGAAVARVVERPAQLPGALQLAADRQGGRGGHHLPGCVRMADPSERHPLARGARRDGGDVPAGIAGVRCDHPHRVPARARDHPPARLALLVATERHRGLGRRAGVIPHPRL